NAEAEVLVALDVLHLLLAGRDQFGAVAVDADVGVRSAEPFRGGEGDIGERALGRVDLGGGGGFALEDPGRKAHGPERGRCDLQKLAPDHSGPPYYLHRSPRKLPPSHVHTYKGDLVAYPGLR